MTTDNNNDASNRYNPEAQEELSFQITPSKPPKEGWPKPVRTAFKLAVAGAVIWAGHDELMVSSRLQSTFFTKLHRGDIFTKTVNTPPPAKGNTDVERGYADIQRIRKLAEQQGDKVSPQVEWQDRKVGPFRLAPIFPRPPQAGITILDNNQQVTYQGKSPQNVYEKYEDIPELLVKVLCFVEDKNICDPEKADTYNAAIDWPRAAWAAALGAGRKMHIVSKVEGGSTLPIQVTKNDSWEKGRTKGLTDKAEQMLTASAEMYAEGTDTRRQRHAKILEYVNTASFAGHPKFGEIKGLKDAMAILMSNNQYDATLGNISDTNESAKIFRQALTLVMAVKMPDESLRSEKGFITLQERVDKFQNHLIDEKIITQSFSDKVRATKLSYTDIGVHPLIEPPAARDKSVDSLRLAIMSKLQLKPVDGMYKLDRWDLKVDSTLDHAVNEAITAKLKSFNDPEIARKNGLIGFQLLRPETAPKVTWAFALNDRLAEGGTVARSRTDTFKGALDLTKGGRQNYGSTGKMRMSETFLDLVIANLHSDLSGKTPEELKAMRVYHKDRLTQWAVDYLSNPERDRSLIAMQRASITEIKYSGRPQGFFTGGGMNYPHNFDRKEDSISYSVQEALAESVNLSWYRITDDIEENMKWHRLKIDPAILSDGPFTFDQEQARIKYMEEFANFEGGVFSARFWRQQKNRIASELAENLANKDENHPAHMTGLYLGLYPESSFDEYAQFMTKFCKGCASKPQMRTLFDDNGKKSAASKASLLATHTDGSIESLMTLYRYITPTAAYDQAKAFIMTQKPELTKEVDLLHSFNNYKSPIPQAVQDLLVEKAKGARTKLAVIYTTLHPDATYEEFEQFIRKECTGCDKNDDSKKQKSSLRNLYTEHSPERQLDIIATLAQKTDKSPQALIDLYKIIDPAASYQTVRQFVARENPQIDSFKSFEKEFSATKPLDIVQKLGFLTSLSDRTPEQLAALYGRVLPGYSLDHMKAFIETEMPKSKVKPDYKKLHARYSSGKFDSQTRFYKFDLNDRGYLTRPIHPLELSMAAQRFSNPDITWKQALENTRQDRIHVYKWLIRSDKKKAQDKAIGIMLDQHAWREIEKSWQQRGYPFKLVPSLATVIGVSGDTGDSLATFNAIFLNEGKTVNITRFTSMHFGVGTPHETHITPGQPASTQVMRPETAQLMLELTEGVVNSEHGTGRRLKDGFTLSDGRKLVVRGKTGTNDESETSGVRVGVFTGTIGDRYSFCISGYITGASAKDKFTSGMAVQALKMLAPELQPLFDRAYGVTPSAAKLIKAVEKKAENQNAAPTAKEAKPQQKISSVLPTATASFSASALLDYDTGTWLHIADTQKWDALIMPSAKRSLGPAPQ